MFYNLGKKGNVDMMLFNKSKKLKASVNLPEAL
jgi:hypothetical protein